MKKLTEKELNLLEEYEEVVEEQEEDDEEDEELEDRGDVFEEEDDEDEDDNDDEESEEDSDEDEEEDEDSEDEDEEDDSEEEDEDDDEEENSRIPRSRLNEVIAQRDSERERIKWLEDQLEKVIQGQSTSKKEEPEPDPYDFDSAEDKYIELVLDGEKAEAIKLRKEIESERQKAYEARVTKMQEAAETSAKSVSESTIEEERYNRVLENTLTTHDFFNHESKAYNAAAVKMANRLMSSYMNEGLTKSEALKAAVEDVTPIYGTKKDVEKSKTREKVARKTAADAQKKQPRDTSRRGSAKQSRDLDKINIAKMSERDFDSLTAKEKKLLRGDG